MEFETAIEKISEEFQVEESTLLKVSKRKGLIKE